MEVHHHSHAHGKKSWKAYFWEFLMLFLAVFCGFLAENQREHILEHKRAKDYAVGLYKDLQRDTVDLRKGIEAQSWVIRYVDSLCFFVKGPDAFQESGRLFMYMRLSANLFSVEWNKATLNQLLNSGNLRYFTNKELTTKISEYNTLSESITVRDEDVLNRTFQEREVWGKIFNANYIYNILQIHLPKNNFPVALQYDSLKNLQIPLVSKDPVLLNEYVMKAMFYKNLTRNLTDNLYPRAISLASEIMKLLKKEYNIK